MIKLKYLLNEIEGTEPGIYYHVTPSKFVNKIQKQGLTVGNKSQWTGARGQDIRHHKGIFLFDNYYDAMKWSFKHNWDKQEEVSIIKVKTDSSDMVKDSHWEAQTGIGDWWVKSNNIHPQQIVEVIPFDVKSWTPALTKKIRDIEHAKGGLSESTKIRNFFEIQQQEDPNGTNHDLKLTCVKCSNSQTCRCSKPKRKFEGLCHSCAGIEFNGKKKVNELEYPLAKEKDQTSYEGYDGWKGKLVWMTPDKFLKLAKNLPEHHINHDSLKNLENRMKENLPVDFLVLEVSMQKKQVIGHEGRHRAMTAKKLGIEKVPVLIFTGSMFKRVPAWNSNDHKVADDADFTPES